MGIADKETVKDKIIASASDFFIRFGFYKTTMDEIARKIHKAKGVLYYYFKSKEDLYAEVVRKELDLVKKELKKTVDAGDDPVTTLENYIKMRFELLNNAKNYHETLHADFRERYAFVEDVRRDFDNFERLQLNKIISEGEKRGYFRVSNLDRIVDVVMIIHKSVEIPLYLQNKYNEYKNIMDEMISLIFNGLKKT
jgi:AcrR family transcriptional regulator